MNWSIYNQQIINKDTKPNWQPGAENNTQLRESNNINTNWKYRSYLVNNADKIIEINQMEACNQCCICPVDFNTGYVSNNPYLYNSFCDNSNPIGYQNSDLKEDFLNNYNNQCNKRTYTIYK